jgi:rod shape-determining protein MreB
MFKTDLHVQIFENRVRVRNLRSGESFEALSRAPFSHPRTLIGNFTELDAAYKEALRKVRGTGWILSSRVLVQAMAKCEGGLTQIETRVLRELVSGHGASRVVVWEGGSLSDDGIRGQLDAGR